MQILPFPLCSPSIPSCWKFMLAFCLPWKLALDSPPSLSSSLNHCHPLILCCRDDHGIRAMTSFIARNTFALFSICCYSCREKIRGEAFSFGVPGRGNRYHPPEVIPSIMITPILIGYKRVSVVWSVSWERRLLFNVFAALSLRDITFCYFRN